MLAAWIQQENVRGLMLNDQVFNDQGQPAADPHGPLDIGHWSLGIPLVIGPCVIGHSFPYSLRMKNCSMSPPGWRYISALRTPDLKTSREFVNPCERLVHVI